jgi:hypothetical protein
MSQILPVNIFWILSMVVPVPSESCRWCRYDTKDNRVRLITGTGCGSLSFGGSLYTIMLSVLRASFFSTGGKTNSEGLISVILPAPSRLLH